jgi:hypothetical protein
MFSTIDDFLGCKKIVQNILTKSTIVLEDSKIEEIAKAILNLIYATGGNYTEESLKDYAELYLRDNLVKYL